MLLELKDIALQKMQAARQKYFSKYPDVFTKMYAFTRAQTARALGYYPYFPAISESDTTEVTIDGKRKIMLGSNNYLGLTNHPEIIEAGIEALQKYGAGLTGSRFLNGNLTLHEELEHQLADFVGKETALVFSTGFSVNLGVIAATVQPGDLLFSDELNHASIVDGARFSQAEVVRYRHNDMSDLKRQMQVHDYQRASLIVTDGVFSMEGDVAKLPEMVGLAQQNRTRIMVDEAHAIGVLGKHGEGSVGHFGLSDQVDLIMGTFSKSLAGVGGFIAGDELIIDYLKHHTRTMIFTAALPPVNVATVKKALDILRREPQRIADLLANADYMRTNLNQMGYDIGSSTTAVIPIVIGPDLKTFNVWKDLLAEGVFTNPIVAPAVPKGRALLRTSYMASHTRQQLDFCLEKFWLIGKKHGCLNYTSYTPN